MKKIVGIPELTDNDWICDFAFTLDIVTHLNTFNCMLQGKNLYAHDMVKTLKRFQLKLQLFHKNVLIKRVDHFQTINLLRIPENKFEEYGDITNALRDDFSQRFGDFQKIETSLAIVRDPFSIDIDNALRELQLEIINVQCDSDVRE